MLYFPTLDVAITEYAPVVANELVAAGQAVLDPPHRPGGYPILDDAEEDRLHRLLLKRAVSMADRRPPKY